MATEFSVLGGGKFANGAITAAFAYAASIIGRDDEVVTADGRPTNVEGNTPTVDTSWKYGSYDEASDDLKLNLDFAREATGSKWEWGGFVVGCDGQFCLTQLATSHNPYGVGWFKSGLDALLQNYTVYSYNHLHPVRSDVGNQFSDQDKTFHLMMSAGSPVYRGTFLDYFGHIYGMRSGSTQGHSCDVASAGWRC